METRVLHKDRPAPKPSVRPFGTKLMRKVPHSPSANKLTRTIQHTGSKNGQDTIGDTD